MFGGVALFAVIFYASGIPKLQRDILQVCQLHGACSHSRDSLTVPQKVPFVGHYFVKEIHPADNVGAVLSSQGICLLTANYSRSKQCLSSLQRRWFVVPGVCVRAVAVCEALYKIDRVIDCPSGG
jgi:hypothetical protein